MLELIIKNSDFLLSGFLTTLQISAISIVIGTLLGAATAWIRYTRMPVISKILDAYVILLQGAPLLVVLLICYFAIPALFGYRTGPNSASIVAFTVFISAYLSEDIRAGLLSVKKNLVSAALASGLTQRQAIRFIVLPIGTRSVIPVLFNQYVRLIKFTSVASTIGVPDLTSNTLLINARVFAPAELLGFVALMYLVTCQLVSIAGRVLQAKFAVKQ
jgi:His/Glu/Gln/Arg/opine family amino acid ABC transporter permease subunit